MTASMAHHRTPKARTNRRRIHRILTRPPPPLRRFRRQHYRLHNLNIRNRLTRSLLRRYLRTGRRQPSQHGATFKRLSRKTFRIRVKQFRTVAAHLRRLINSQLTAMNRHTTNHLPNQQLLRIKWYPNRRLGNRPNVSLRLVIKPLRNRTDRQITRRIRLVTTNHQ